MRKRPLDKLITEALEIEAKKQSLLANENANDETDLWERNADIKEWSA